MAFVEQEPCGPQGPRREAASEKSPTTAASDILAWDYKRLLVTESGWERRRWKAEGLIRRESSVGWVEKPTDLYLGLVWKSKQWWNRVWITEGPPKRWDGQTLRFVFVASTAGTLKGWFYPSPANLTYMTVFLSLRSCIISNNIELIGMSQKNKRCFLGSSDSFSSDVNHKVAAWTHIIPFLCHQDMARNFRSNFVIVIHLNWLMSCDSY